MDLEKPRELSEEIQNHCTTIMVHDLCDWLIDQLDTYFAGDHAAKTNGMLNVLSNTVANIVVSKAKEGFEIDCIDDICHQIKRITKEVLIIKKNQLAQIKKETH